jgi:hypothetical protein
LLIGVGKDRLSKEVAGSVFVPPFKGLGQT